MLSPFLASVARSSALARASAPAFNPVSAHPAGAASRWSPVHAPRPARLVLVARPLDPPAPPSGPTPGDWDLLFDAVIQRLAHIAGERSDVHECVAALGQLQAWQRNARPEPPRRRPHSFAVVPS